MTRKDTILISVVINAGLLAVLFATAVIYDTDKGNEQIVHVRPLVENQISSSEASPTLIASATTRGEADNVLKYYASPVSEPIVVQSSEMLPPESLAAQTSRDEDSPAEKPVAPVQQGFVEVIVKRGDTLEKIAKANKTTVGAIRRANHLDNERLSIGQVLKISTQQNTSTASNPESNVEGAKSEGLSAEPVYYVIKSGDNPWKIAKHFDVKYDEIIRLNNLDEEKARNLKIGDRIRVK
jgi:peptidoglycan DL-endopeptidase LytF